MTIRLMIADDHAMVRRGLQVFLATQPDIALVGEAANGQETLDRAAELRPDVILMDLNMPVLNGIETTARLIQAQPEIKVIVLTSFADQDHVLPAIQAGAKGYLLKDIEPDMLIEAVRRVHQGRVELHPDAAGMLVNHLSGSERPLTKEDKGSSEEDRLGQLTPRELEVLRHLATGMSNKEIGESLVITEKTVKTHVSHLLDKLGFSDRTQAAIFAVKRGIGL
ncbi:response regulator [Cohnella thailandensis]|uniref:Response regulator transcription factor n=1 Tax=Cohnella thailandensis TaxID=557557 RepID=A0A841T4B4_9BACL|nr:response regulator transcription factor [Cohnella thailandensis]MBB6637475.1 response regulator transcription factor [Cohnella thailandensis]MBP1977508.1 DNA-binding NarL/FixJ family response regulator [Cohnella thailandensis]